MNVLLTNDDGISSPGLRALYHELKSRGHYVWVVAPMTQQSAASRCLTVFEPLRTQAIREENFSGTGVFGTPADCVKIALGGLLTEKPDLVISGINQGQNVGSDIPYSGTINAAAEGAHVGIPSVAFSHAAHEGPEDWAEVAKMAVDLTETIDFSVLPKGQVVNVNFPALPREQVKGVRVCPQSPAIWRNGYERRTDPRGGDYWWLAGKIDDKTIGDDTDRALLYSGYVTVTPLRFEYTARDSMEALAERALDACLKCPGQGTSPESA